MILVFFSYGIYQLTWLCFSEVNLNKTLSQGRHVRICIVWRFAFVLCCKYRSTATKHACELCSNETFVPRTKNFCFCLFVTCYLSVPLSVSLSRLIPPVCPYASLSLCLPPPPPFFLSSSVCFCLSQSLSLPLLCPRECTLAQTHAFVHTHVLSHTQTHTYARTHACRHTHLRTRTYRHTHTHARTHTHTHNALSKIIILCCLSHSHDAHTTTTKNNKKLH